MYTYQNRPIKVILLFLATCLILFPKAGHTVESVPEKIVSLGPIITDMIYLLDADDKLVAVTSYCKLPEDSTTKQIIGTVMQMNVEKIISLEPDLVLANALTRQKQIDSLKKQGVNVQRLPTPGNFNEICKRLTDLGAIIGKHEKALAVVNRAKKEVEKIQSQALTKPKRTVFIQIGLKPLKTSGKHTFIHEYIEFAGGINVASDSKDGVYSREKVLELNPDVIFIATMGSSKKAGENEKNAWERFKFLKAVKNNEIHILNPDVVCSPTPEQFSKGLFDFYTLIHPPQRKGVIFKK